MASRGQAHGLAFARQTDFGHGAGLAGVSLERPAYGLRVPLKLAPEQAVAEVVAHLGQPVMVENRKS